MVLFLYAFQKFFEGSLSFRCSFVNTCALPDEKDVRRNLHFLCIANNSDTPIFLLFLQLQEIYCIYPKTACEPQKDGVSNISSSGSTNPWFNPYATSSLIHSFIMVLPPLHILISIGMIFMPVPRCIYNCFQICILRIPS